MRRRKTQNLKAAVAVALNGKPLGQQGHIPGGNCRHCQEARKTLEQLGLINPGGIMLNEPSALEQKLTNSGGMRIGKEAKGINPSIGMSETAQWKRHRHEWNLPPGLVRKFPNDDEVAS